MHQIYKRLARASLLSLKLTCKLLDPLGTMLDLTQHIFLICPKMLNGHTWLGQYDSGSVDLVSILPSSIGPRLSWLLPTSAKLSRPSTLLFSPSWASSSPATISTSPGAQNSPAHSRAVIPWHSLNYRKEGNMYSHGRSTISFHWCTIKAEASIGVATS